MDGISRSSMGADCVDMIFRQFNAVFAYSTALLVSGPFPANLGKGSWLELGKNKPHFWTFCNFF